MTADGRQLIGIGEQTGEGVADCGFGTWRDGEEQLANARLIAAAPDLLAALKAAHDFIVDEADNRAAAGSEMSDYEREPRELAEGIAAAIAKAEGV
jgi:hypothetical protein